METYSKALFANFKIADLSTSRDGEFFFRFTADGQCLFERYTRPSGSRTLEPVLQEEHLQLPGWQVQLVHVHEALVQAIARDF